MSRHMHSAQRVLVVGGGIAGLSVAAQLAQSGLPVTVLEASQLGFGASTRNQGWLYSGAWFAPEQPDLARMCHESLEQTVRFCPECLEPNSEPMVYLMNEAETDIDRWTSAWTTAGIPFQSLTSQALCQRIPGLATSARGPAYQLPDRAIRTDLLLRRLAEVAQKAGAEIRTGTTVSRLVQDQDSVQGVETSRGEVLLGRLVILAGNARGGSLFPGFGIEAVGMQPEVALVVQKTHLVSIKPEICQSPLCIVDAEGFNHIPHRPTSVFGSNRWVPVRHGEDERLLASEVKWIWAQISRFFPGFRRENHSVLEWAGNTVQAMRVEQIEPGRASWPTVVDHERESPSIRNLLSIFPGRASLWPQLAQQTQEVVSKKLESAEMPITLPPWGSTSTPPYVPPPALQSSREIILYHCQKCGDVASREPELPAPICCDSLMAQAAKSTH